MTLNQRFLGALGGERIYSLCSFLVNLLLCLSSPVAADSINNNYRLGTGYALGETGIRLGGYASATIDVPHNAPWYLEASDVSLFISWDIGARLRFFSELEAGDVLSGGEQKALGTQNASFEFERFYLDTLVNNHLTIRLGKFLTPVGQWNQTHAAPLVWTTSRPVATENLFSTHASGIMAHGAMIVANRQLEYNIYGDVTKSIDPHKSSDPFKNAAGARLRYYLSDTLQIGVSFANYALSDRSSNRYSLAGLDATWTYHKLEFSTEAVYRTRNNHHPEHNWQGFIQGVIPIYQNWYGIGRYEAFTQTNQPVGHVGVVGLSYRPLPPLIWKLEYRLGTHNETLAPNGFMASVAVLF